VRSTVITGTSRGLGAALFDELYAAGDRVLALGRRFTDDQHAAAAAEPHRVRLRRTDLADRAALPEADELAAFLDECPGADVAIVHNAAVFEPFGRIGALLPAGVASAIAVNLTAPVLLTNALLAARGAAAGPSDTAGPALTVMLISSSAAHRVSGGRSVYGATKRAAEMFLETLGEEHAGDPRTRVVIVDPGVMDTDMQAVVREHARTDPYFPGRERFLARHERGELPSPVDVARKIMAEHLC
jgi:benzil reductase ((S)-benzoin forming)